MSECVIRDVRLPDHASRVDLLVRNGLIAAIGPRIVTDVRQFSGNGALLTPGFVESHIHLDKACILDRCHNETGTLEGAIASVGVAKMGFTEEDVYARGARVLKKAIVQGTNAMRTHVEIDPVIGLTGFNAVLRLKRDFAWALDLQICVFPQEGMTNNPGTEELLEAALSKGADVLGGCPYTDTDPNAQIRLLFEMATRHDVDLDFHLDFDLDPGWRHLDEIARQAIAFAWQGRVAIGHVTKLSALPPRQLRESVLLMKDAGIALTVLPVTDLFLMGRNRDHLVPRGVAPAHVFHAAGVCCTVATNNVLNPFTPYGDCSLTRVANLYANVHQLSTATELEACFDMVTTAPMQLISRSRSLVVGEEATFVALPAETGAQAIAEIARPSWGMKMGRFSFEQPAARLLTPETVQGHEVETETV
ncbi:amidohydrolase family protein [uncultured Roseibium sp.]|uniref:amidohydrolase family protein n=1 Tax=uncultured Roseibium sp. TaxID=1936171 RepID=UPI00262C5144|nr:amidohydrolase family protein [uncultured Roseibium sp.]